MRPIPVVFTGPTSILAAQVAYIQAVLEHLRGNVWITGGAPGVDLFVYEELARNVPDDRHILVIPYGYRNGATEMAVVGALKRGHEVIHLPRPVNTKRHPNLLRNDYMCEKALEINPDRATLVGFPGSPIEQQRSGTWACIRSARRLGLPVQLYPLSEAPGMSDGGVFKGPKFKHGRIQE